MDNHLLEVVDNHLLEGVDVSWVKWMNFELSSFLHFLDED